MRIASLAQNLGLGRAPAGSGKKVVTGVAAERAEDLRFLAGLAASGAFTPVIDQVFSLDQAVAADARVDSGHKRGNVVIRMDTVS